MIAFLKGICEKLNFKKSADDNLSMNILKVCRRQLDGEERAGGFASCGLVMVEWLFLAVPWGFLRFVIVVLPDHTHYF